MAYFEILPFYLLPLLVLHASASCSDLVHSECDMRATSADVLLAIQLPTQQNCRKLCDSIGEGCKFFTFEEDSFHQNCQLYRQSMTYFISHHCNVISGSKEVNSTCDNYDGLRKDEVVQAQCQYDAVVEETIKTNGSEHCVQLCATLSQCGAWEFLKEEQECHIRGTSQKKCLVNIGAYAPYTQCETDPPQGLPSSCLAISHSECNMRDSNVLLALRVDAETNCQAMCEAVGEGCKFFTFEKTSYRENCQLHTIEMTEFIETCNVLGGPSGYAELCDYSRMRGGDVIEGQCAYGVVEERMNTQTWQSCQMLSRRGWDAWKYFKEEKSCQLLGSQHKNCLVKFGVADPEKTCGGDSDV